MTRVPQIALLLLSVLVGGCASHSTNRTTRLADRTTWLSAPAMRAPIEPARDGKILVFVSGDASRQGPHWITADASILTVEEVCGAGDEGAIILEPKYVVIHRMVDGRLLELRYDLERRTETQKRDIRLQHGDAIIFPWTNCW